MAQMQIGSLRVILRKSKAPVIMVLVIAVILSTAALIVVDRSRRQAEAQAESYRQQIARLEEEKALLDQRIAELGTQSGVLSIAQDELGLVDPNTVVLTPEPAAD